MLFAALPEWRSCPFSAALFRSLPGGGLGEVSHSDGHSVVIGKKEADYIHNRTSRMALVPLVSILACVCNRLKCRIQLSYQIGILAYHIELMFVKTQNSDFHACLINVILHKN